MKHWLSDFWDFVDNRKVARRAAFFWVLWLTYEVTMWTMDFATASPRPGMDVTAIIAAVWAPMAVLQAAIFKMYNDARIS